MKQTVKKTIRGIIIFLLTLILVDIFCMLINFVPIFSAPLVYHDDGGSIEYYGLYYKIIKYNIKEDEIYHKKWIIGWFNIKYDENYFAYEIVDKKDKCVEPSLLIGESVDYYYYLPCEKLDEVFIEYKHGKDYTLREVLESDLLSIEDLMSEGLDVIKKKKEVNNEE
ncbi:MAG: hypothetical protein Q4G04_03940 [bacterium]|nr:hypothetical protein [bacterium]